VAAVLTAAALGGAPEAGPAPKIAAHRGGAALWPENSLLAFRNALGLGVDYVETDVHLTADGQVVVIHDPTLERTTTGRGAVRDQTLAALAPVRLKARDGTVTTEPVPTLAQLLDLLRPSSVGLLLEIKVDDRKQRYPAIEETVLALLRERDMAARTLVMAFERETVRRVRGLDPSQRTVVLVGRGQLRGAAPTQGVGWARDLGATAAGFDFRLVDADVVAAARRAGVVVAAWTVNEEWDVHRMVDLGADVVITDRPDLAVRLRGQP
jgi:glycerophosphoryl diester phosphodiesterase